MKLYKFIVLIVPVLLVLCSLGRVMAASPAAVLTLDRAKQIALANSPTIGSARERVAQALEAVVQARADYLPTLSLTGSWDYTEATALSGASQEEAYTSGVSATQVLFRGFYRKYNTLAAQYGEKMDRAALADARRTLVWSVAQGYLNVQLAAEKIRIAESDLAFNREQLKEAEVKEKLGAGAYSDVLNYKTRANAARTALIQARQSLKEYTCGLAALMGYEDARLPRGMTVPALPDTAHPEGAEETAPDIPAALAHRPDLREAALAVEAAEARIGRARSGHFPTVSLTGGYGVSRANDFGGLGESDNLGASLGVSVSFDLFDGGATQSAVRAAQSQKRELEQTQKAARISAASEIQTAMDKLASARQTLSLQAETTRFTEETRDLVKIEYAAGQVSLVRMNEAQNDLVAAQGDLAEARVSLGLALEELAYYTGADIETHTPSQ